MRPTLFRVSTLLVYAAAAVMVLHVNLTVSDHQAP